MAKFEKIPRISEDGSVDFTYKIDGKEVNEETFEKLLSDDTIEHIPINFKFPEPKNFQDEDDEIENVEDLAYFIAQEVIDSEDLDEAALIILEYIDQSSTASYYSGRADLANELKREFNNVAKQTSKELNDYLNGDDED